MYKYQIGEMSFEILEGIKNKFDEASVNYPSNVDLLPVIQSALENYWKDRIAITWTAEDVITIAEDMGVSLTISEAITILNNVLRKMEANVGVNWAVIKEAIHNYRNQSNDN